MIVDCNVVRVDDLTMLKLGRNCYGFTDFYGREISTHQLINSDVYVYFKEKLHKVRPYNEPYKVVLPIISPYYVDQIMINDEILTNGKPIHLKFFLDKCDWHQSVSRKEYYRILEYVAENDKDVYEDLFKQANEKMYFSKVFIKE